jgi:hypothetical protein
MASKFIETVIACKSEDRCRSKTALTPDSSRANIKTGQMRSQMVAVSAD